MTRKSIPQIKINNDLAQLDMGVVPAALDRWNVGVRASEATADNILSIYDTIGENWDGSGITASRVAGALRQIGARDVVVNVNSPGGDMFEGIAIYNLLRDHPHNVTVKVVGLAASAASIIAMAGDQVEIAKSGFLMIHNCWVMAMGNAADLREVADMLEPFDASMAGIYAARTGIDEKTIAEMMAKETWINGQAAVDQKFADAFLPADQVGEDSAIAKAFAPVLAVRQADVALASSGLSRAKRKEIINRIRSGTPGAATVDTSGTPGAAEHATQDAGVMELAASLRRVTAIVQPR